MPPLSVIGDPMAPASWKAPQAQALTLLVVSMGTLLWFATDDGSPRVRQAYALESVARGYMGDTVCLAVAESGPHRDVGWGRGWGAFPGVCPEWVWGAAASATQRSGVISVAHHLTLPESIEMPDLQRDDVVLRVMRTHCASCGGWHHPGCKGAPKPCELANGTLSLTRRSELCRWHFHTDRRYWMAFVHTVWVAFLYVLCMRILPPPPAPFVPATRGVGSGGFRTVDFGGAIFNWSYCVPCVLRALRCTMFIFCVKEADLGMIACVAPWFSE